MQKTVEIPLGAVKAYGSLSGYVYLHLPQYLCKQFGLSASTSFAVTYKDGRLILEQIKEEKDEST